MNQVIIYMQDNGVVAVVRPTVEALELHGIEVIARKDVPYGKKFAIVNEDIIPSDRSTRDAWFVDENDLNDGVGADYGVGSLNNVVGWNDDGTPVLRRRE